jgi:predicted nucleic acid-binding protein
MTVILDTSAAIEILLERRKCNVFREIIESAESVITSSFFKIETANVLRKYYRGNYIKKEECFALFELAQSMIDEFIPMAENSIEALHEAIRLNYSTYDMLYLILARKNKGILLTCDGPLNTIAEKEMIDIVKF